MKTICLWASIALVVSGCAGKRQAREREQRAFAAGQQRAFAQMSEARRTNIRVIGPVRYPEVTWRPGLTLALAISQAEYTDRRDPRTILVSRQREQITFDPADLLRGKDLDLEPGDTIEIQP